MDSRDILERYAARAGWDEQSQLALALRYIDTQTAPEAFEDFLDEHLSAEEEQELSGGYPEED